MVKTPPTAEAESVFVKASGDESGNEANVGVRAGLTSKVPADECAAVTVVLGGAPDEKHREVGG